MAGVGDSLRLRDYSAGYVRTGHQSLLQSVIRNLVDSADEEERIEQRSKLENDLEITSERMDRLVHEHKDKLHATLDTFKNIDSKIGVSQEKIRVLRANLQSCKTLLRCKREELKRLWVEDVKFKHMLKLIDTIEEVRGVPELVKKYKGSKHYLHATELLVNTVAKLERELGTIDALRELKQELRTQKENLHVELIDELHKHLYVKPTAKKSQKSHTQGDTGPSPALPRRVGSVVPGGRPSRSATRTMAMEKEATAATQLSHPPIKEEDFQVSEDLDVDPELDSNHYMAVLVDALSTLGKTGEAVEAIQSRMQKEFLLITERASIQVTRTAEREVGLLLGKKPSKDSNPKLLLKLLQMCFERFRSVVSAHSVLLGHLQRAKRIYNKRASYVVYEENHVWSSIQLVLQNLLEVYLAYNEEDSNQVGLTTFTGTSDVQAMFMSKKKSNPKTKKQLFRFESSRHAISISSYMKEQRDIELAEGLEGVEPGILGNQHFTTEEQPSIVQHLVCKPSGRNITVIFGAVRGFILEVEDALRMPEDDHCQLYHFLHDFVEDSFLNSVRSECAGKLQTSTKAEAAKATASDQRTAKFVGSKQSVLNSVIVVWQLVEELKGLMKDLPMYSRDFLSILCGLLGNYRDSCFSMYRELTSVMVDGSRGEMGGGGMGGEAVVSSKWARDDDINRMIRSLPSWAMLRQGTRTKSMDEDHLGKHGLHGKESDILTTNMGSEPLKKTSVILTHDNLRLIAVLHESLDWFNSQLKLTVMDLTNPVPGVSSPGPLPTVRGGDEEAGALDHEANALDLMEQLSRIQFDFQSLSETTVIMLHLEVRCHCFFFLQPIVQRVHYEAESSEAESQVRQLATDLKNIDTTMVAVLTPEKYRYMFEGLGHLVASIFINSVVHMKTISTTGIKRMCQNISTLQNCLSKITMIREKDLDRARQFFEMLYLSDEEIFHQIGEEGTIFSQKDYTSALTLLCHSRPDFDETVLKSRLEELDRIFSGDAV